VLHLRVIAPGELTDRVLDVLDAEPGATAIVAMPGVARSPSGDLVTADLAREAANDVLERLSALGLRRSGVITLEEIDTALSDAAEQAERDAPGEGQDAVVWEQIEDRTHEESTLSWTFLSFLTIATVIAGIGVLLDQPVLIVGAMVVGPEFGPLAGICVALVRRRFDALRRSLRALLIGFPVAIGVTLLLTLLARAVGLVERSDLDRNRPLTDFISHPDTFSFIVAFLAGVAGMLSLTAAKSGALIGVLISVTTVPAAGNAAVAIAFGEPGSAGGSALQLSLNLAGIIIAGTLTLVAARRAWRRTP
jgi:uncharacterized hydrophobic protein (TIGR00271 family)